MNSMKCSRQGCQRGGGILIEICRRDEGEPQRNTESRLCKKCFKELAARTKLPKVGDTFVVEKCGGY